MTYKKIVVKVLTFVVNSSIITVAEMTNVKNYTKIKGEQIKCVCMVIAELVKRSKV